MTGKGKLNSKYKLIVFDAYGTLLDVYSIAKLADELFDGKGSVLANVWRDKQIEYTRLVTLADAEGAGHYENFWQLTKKALCFSCDLLGLDLDENKKIQLLGQYAKLSAFDDALPCLKMLKENALQVSILSNANSSMITQAIESNGLEIYLDKLISADEVRQFKVSPACYALVLNHFSVAKNEVLFISSNSWDVIGASWYGFDCLWLNRSLTCFEQIGKTPKKIASHLNDLGSYLQ